MDAVTWKPLAAGFVGQHLGPGVANKLGLTKVLGYGNTPSEIGWADLMPQLGVGVGAGLVTMDPVVGAIAAVTDFGLYKLYHYAWNIDPYTFNEILTPVRGAISAGTAVYVRTML